MRQHARAPKAGTSCCLVRIPDPDDIAYTFVGRPVSQMDSLFCVESAGGGVADVTSVLEFHVDPHTLPCLHSLLSNDIAASLNSVTVSNGCGYAIPLVASVTQEGLIRKARTPLSPAVSKL
ncbi:hypothetical protein L1987_58968 [Smallanthus sonchifolius]|uniref:Uncharacterized protein n=1 Tax=Smallanthus sonchifolius TaxID=185202 RepID=A0ACB9D4I5_9ASTR|nr:hypothetical protein L1987_58968 [Smallanthus sonchifolius]